MGRAKDFSNRIGHSRFCETASQNRSHTNHRTCFFGKWRESDDCLLKSGDFPVNFFAFLSQLFKVGVRLSESLFVVGQIHGGDIRHYD